MRLGVGMRQTGGANNASILADAFEAYIAVPPHTDLDRSPGSSKRALAQLDRAEAADRRRQDGAPGVHPGAVRRHADLFRRAEGRHDRRFTSQVRTRRSPGRRDRAVEEGAQQSAAAMALALLRTRHPDPPELPEPPLPRQRPRDRPATVAPHLESIRLTTTCAQDVKVSVKTFGSDDRRFTQGTASSVRTVRKSNLVDAIRCGEQSTRRCARSGSRT